MTNPANPTAPGAPAQATKPVQATPAAAAKPAAEKKEPKAKTPKAPKDPSLARPRLPKPPDEHVITVLKPGSKARGAHDRFMQYKTGQTVKQYVDIIREMFSRTDGQTIADIRWDVDHKFIHVGPTVIDVPPEPQAPVAQPAAGTTPPASA